MRALVTGHRGFVGRHFVERLAIDDWDLETCDVAPEPGVIAEESGPLVDCRDWFRWHPDDHEIDLVIHCAAIVGGRKHLDDRPLAIADNLSIDAALFQWALKARPKRIVYFSSSAAYPVMLQARPSIPRLPQLLDEHHIGDLAGFGQPDGIYGWAKLIGEQLAGQARREGLAVTVVRPFSGYGSDQGDEYPFGAFLRRMSEHQEPFVIWGDGTQIRHWIHIDDIVGAVRKMVDLELDGPVNLAGTDSPVTFAQFARIWFTEAGWTPSEIRYMADAPTGVHTRAAKISQLRAFYEPQITLREGIRRALASRGLLAP